MRQLPTRRAESLREAVRTFNPNQPLIGEQLKTYYVDRGAAPRRHLRTILLDSWQEDNEKFLFSGHTGSGKSTELNLLCQELADNYFTVKISTRNSVSPTDMNYVDLVTIAAMSLFAQAVEQDVLARAPGDLALGLLQDLGRFINDRIFGQRFTTAGGVVEVSAALKLKIAEFGARYKNEVVTRDQIRERLAPRLSEVIGKMDEICAQTLTRTGKPVLLVFDDTDKPDAANARKLFFERSATLTAFQAFAIYSFPIYLRYDREYNTFQEGSFRDCFLLPNIKLRTKSGQPLPDNANILRDFINYRLHPDLMADEARQQLIEASGGLVRTLINMCLGATVNARGRGAERIEIEDANKVILERQNDFVAGLRQNDYPILAQRHQDKRLSSDPEMQELLHQLALLQYNGDEGDWCDVNPVVLELLKERLPQNAA